MMKALSTLLIRTLAVGCLLLVAAPAFATEIYGDYFGTTVNFLGVQETTNTPGDPEPLFEAPVHIGDQLLFFPSNFVAQSAGGGVDTTAALLEMDLQAVTGTYIEMIHLTEAGDTFLAGAGTASTGTFVGLSGVVTVLGADDPGDVGQLINFVGIFDQDTFDLTNDAGATAWLGSIDIDVAAAVPNVTLAHLQIDNFLFAASEATTSALIQKKASGALIITVPEPTSLALMGLGVLGAAVIGRRRTR